MAQDNNQNPKKGQINRNFLEMLKNSPTAFPQRSLSETQAYRENYLRGIFSERVKKSEKEIYNGKTRQLERETQTLLKETQKELKELKKTRASLAKEVEKAVFSPPKKTTPYFLSFLLHLKSILLQSREILENSATWLSAQNTRSAKKGAFWGTFLNKKKGGTQFLLSNEHYMARSAG
ncbi:MAG: DUF5660 family protein [Candidatus Shapirobacteria bacterium]